MYRSISRSMILSMNEHRLIGRKSLGAVCDFFPALGINITSESRHFCGIYPNVRQPLYNQMSCLLIIDSAFWIVMGCMPSGPGVLTSPLLKGWYFCSLGFRASIWSDEYPMKLQELAMHPRSKLFAVVYRCNHPFLLAAVLPSMLLAISRWFWTFWCPKPFISTELNAKKDFRCFCQNGLHSKQPLVGHT